MTEWQPGAMKRMAGILKRRIFYHSRQPHEIEEMGRGYKSEIGGLHWNLPTLKIRATNSTSQKRRAEPGISADCILLPSLGLVCLTHNTWVACQFYTSWYDMLAYVYGCAQIHMPLSSLHMQRWVRKTTENNGKNKSSSAWLIICRWVSETARTLKPWRG